MGLMSDPDRTIPERPDERRNWLDGLAIAYALAIFDDDEDGTDEHLRGITW